MTERAMPYESTIRNERMPSLAHGIEQMLRDHGPFWAQIVRKGGGAYWAEVEGIRNGLSGQGDDIFVHVSNTTIPGVRAMDELVEALFHVHPERSLLTHPCPLCPLDTAWFS